MEAGFKGFFGGEAEFRLYFGGIDGVAAVMAGAVRDMGDQGVGVDAFGTWAVRICPGQGLVLLKCVKDPVTHLVNDVQIDLFVAAADVVHLAGSAFFQDQVNAAVVVVHVQPVPDLPAVAIHGDGFAGQDVGDHERDQFFGKLERAVVVGAVADGGVQAVGFVVRPDQVVGGGFAGGIGGVGGIGRGFRKRRVIGLQGAVNLVCGDVVEPVAGPGVFVQPDVAGRLEQGVGAHDVGFDEGVRTLDGAVHVGFRRKVDNGVDVVGHQEIFHQGLIQNVAVDERESGMVVCPFQVVPVAGIGQCIKDNNVILWIFFNPVVNKICTDKAGATCDK